MINNLFVQQFRQNFFHTGTPAPCSPAVARALTAYLHHKQEGVNVLEAGPGDGAMTVEIASLLAPGDTLDLVEINPAFASVLQTRLDSDQVFQAHRDQITLINADLRYFPLNRQYDFIIATLPFVNFPPELMETLLLVILDHLKPGGIFSFVNYIFWSRLKFFLGGEIWQRYQQNRIIVDRYTRQYQVNQRAVIANIPPTWVNYWQKPPK